MRARRPSVARNLLLLVVKLRYDTPQLRGFGMRSLPSVSRGALLCASAAVALAAGSAEARSIRVDNGGGGWEQNFGNVLDDAGDTGIVTLPFEFFGTTTLAVDPRGFARSEIVDPDSSPNLYPLIFSSEAPNPERFFITFDWGGRDRDCAAAPALCGPDGERRPGDPPLDESVAVDRAATVIADDAFRITWLVNRDSALSGFQLVVWKLFNEDYVVEFNYDQIQGDLSQSYLGFFLDPALPFGFFADASAYGDGFIDLNNCETFEGCQPGDNFIAAGFPPGLRNAFLAPFVEEEPTTGRALFYIDAAPGDSDVPEPGSLALLLLGLTGIAGSALRRRIVRST